MNNTGFYTSSTTDPAGSVFAGAGRHVPTQAPAWLPGHDKELRARLQSGGRLLIVIRNSSPNRDGVADAVAEAPGVIKALREHAGLDLSGCWPEDEYLVETLMASPHVTVSTAPADEKGKTKKYRLRSVLVEIVGTGIVLSLAAGSAHKVDGNGDQQAVVWTVRVLTELGETAVGIAASAIDRVCRDAWSIGPVLRTLRSIEQRNGYHFSCDGQVGRWDIDESQDIVWMQRAQAAQTEARSTIAKTTQGAKNRTGSIMVNGRVSWGLSVGVPPGLFTYQSKRTRRFYATFDSPDFYPDPDDVTTMLPDVRHDDGRLVDQAENVPRLLEAIATRTPEEVLALMKDLRYSTQRLRLSHGHTRRTYYGGPDKPLEDTGWDAYSSWTRALLNNLEFYRTGTLTRTIDGETVTITGLMPPGGWMTKETYLLIDSKMKQNREANAAKRKWAWSGLPVTIDGRKARLKARRTSNEDTGVHYLLELRNSRGVSHDQGPDTRGVFVPAVPDEVLMTAILEGAESVSGTVLSRLLPPQKEDIAVQETAELALVEQSLCRLETTNGVRYTRLMATDPVSGRPMLADGFALMLSREWEATAVEIAQKQSEAEKLRVDIETKRAQDATGLTLTSLGRLLQDLERPGNSHARQFIRSGVRDLAFTTERIRAKRWRGTTVRFTGSLATVVDGATHLLPFEGEYSSGPATDLEQRALRAVTLLRAGNVARNVGEGETHYTSRMAAELLGVDSRSFGISNCPDPALLRLGMAALFPDPVAGERAEDVTRLEDLVGDPALVADFGDVAGLAQRVRDVYTQGKCIGWLSARGGRGEVLALTAAAQGVSGPLPSDLLSKMRHTRIAMRRPQVADRRARWTFREGQWPVLTPCGFCGGSVCAAAAWREAQGYVCLNPECRRDQAGVRWPSRFDQYLAHREAWEGVAGLDLTDGFTPRVAKNVRGGEGERVVCTGRRTRPFSDLSERERKDLKAAFEDRANNRIQDIRQRFNLDLGDMYEFFWSEGLTPRNEGAHRPRKARGRKSAD